MTLQQSWLLASVLLAQTAQPLMAAQPLLFTPETGFSGWSQGDGSLQLLGSTSAFHVRSHGTVQTDGSLDLLHN